jgi:hypothetical protein
MTALVVYESMFGNTRRIAEAIAEGIAETLPVTAVEVGAAPDGLSGYLELLVVGGPTHVHGMSSPRTRASAAERIEDPVVSQRIGLRDWLERVAPAKGGIRAVAFDTRINGPTFITGSAAKGFEKGLRIAGFRVDEPARSFLVGAHVPAEEDALLPGQLDEARAWGRQLGQAVPAGSPV